MQEKEFLSGNPHIKKITAKVSAACSRGKFKWEGKGRDRRIDENSFHMWMWEVREEEMRKEG